MVRIRMLQLNPFSHVRSRPRRHWRERVVAWIDVVMIRSGQAAGTVMVSAAAKYARVCLLLIGRGPPSHQGGVVVTPVRSIRSTHLRYSLQFQFLPVCRRRLETRNTQIQHCAMPHRASRLISTDRCDNHTSKTPRSASAICPPTAKSRRVCDQELRIHILDLCDYQSPPTIHALRSRQHDCLAHRRS